MREEENQESKAGAAEVKMDISSCPRCQSNERPSNGCQPRKQHTHTGVQLSVHVCGKSEKGKSMVVLAVKEGVRIEWGQDRI